MFELCPPAIIYLLFSVTQIIIDLFKGLRNTAIMKTFVAFMVTLLLNILCERGLNIVSWIIVFVPFILMTVVVSMLLYIFGLDAATGKLNKTITNNSNITTDKNGNIIIYDPNYNNLKPPLYYKYPNLIVTNPGINETKTNTSSSNIILVPNRSSSTAYQS